VQDCELVTADAPKRSGEQPAAKAGGAFPRGFSRSGRLLKHSDFERVYKQGRRHFSAHLTVFYLRQAEGALPGDAYRKKARASASPSAACWAAPWSGTVSSGGCAKLCGKGVRCCRVLACVPSMW